LGGLLQDENAPIAQWCGSLTCGAANQIALLRQSFLQQSNQMDDKLLGYDFFVKVTFCAWLLIFGNLCLTYSSLYEVCCLAGMVIAQAIRRTFWSSWKFTEHPSCYNRCIMRQGLNNQRKLVLLFGQRFI